MRLNKFIATATGVSRRQADVFIAAGRATVNGQMAKLGAQVADDDAVVLDGKLLTLDTARTLVMLHKPVGFVSSRRAQARDARTLYELLPPELRPLKTVGRLDRDSSGLILLTDDGDFAHRMTHPSFAKTKVYLVRLNQPLTPENEKTITENGVELPDGVSRLTLDKMMIKELNKPEQQALAITKPSPDLDRRLWRVTMSEGRNRQIRRTFTAVGLTVEKLHRIRFGAYELDDLPEGRWKNAQFH